MTRGPSTIEIEEVFSAITCVCREYASLDFAVVTGAFLAVSVDFCVGDEVLRRKARQRQ